MWIFIPRGDIFSLFAYRLNSYQFFLKKWQHRFIQNISLYKHVRLNSTSVSYNKNNKLNSHIRSYIWGPSRDEINFPFYSHRSVGQDATLIRLAFFARCGQTWARIDPSIVDPTLLELNEVVLPICHCLARLGRTPTVADETTRKDWWEEHTIHGERLKLWMNKRGETTADAYFWVNWKHVIINFQSLTYTIDILMTCRTHMSQWHVGQDDIS